MRLIVMAALLILTGCGVRFANVSQFNKVLPDDFKNRVLWAETDIFKYNLEQLAGHVVYAKAEGKFDRGVRLVKKDRTPTLKAVDKGRVYHSKIDKGAAAEGNYLAFAAKFDDTQTEDVTIIDTAQVFIPYDDVPIDDLLKEADKPLPPDVSKRYYVQAVLLATVTRIATSKISANASGVVGDAFGAKGNVYKQDEEGSTDYRISLLLIDLEKMKMLKQGSGAQPIESSELLRGSKAKGMTVEEIGGMESLKAVPPPQ
jgi:hypothetical protein